MMTITFIKKAARFAIIGILGCSVSAIAAPQNTVAYNPEGVVLNLKNKNLSLVKRGSYLVNAIGNCNSCHVTPAPAPLLNSVYSPGGDPYKDGNEMIDPLRFLGGGRTFGTAPNQITTPELTPNAAGNPGKLTLKQFISAMHTGKDPDDASRTLQVFPWPVYKNLTNRDVKAIYEYLRSLPSSPTLMMAAATPYKCVTINTGSGIYCKEYKCTAATCPPGSWTLVKTVSGTCPAQCPF